jgi:hypothetical protein
MMSANDDNDDKLEKVCVTTCVNDMIVSDDDSVTVIKTLKTTSSPSTDNSSYSGSDDETFIESEQPLFLETPPPVSNTSDGSNSVDTLLGCDVGVAGDDDAMIALFLQDTFEPNAPGCRNHHQPSLAASTFPYLLDVNEMDALLHAGSDEMFLTDLCLES